MTTAAAIAALIVAVLAGLAAGWTTDDGRPEHGTLPFPVTLRRGRT
jgi:hypothetical protein